MNFKKIILIFSNIFFLFLVFYACYLFSRTDSSFNANEIVQNSELKGKTFHANIKEITLIEGMQAWFMEDKTAPLIAVDFCFQNAGYAFDEDGKLGLSSVASKILKYGAGQFDSEMYNNLLEENAVEITFDVSVDSFLISMTTPKENAKLAFDVLKAVLFEPHLREEHINIIKSQQLTALKMQNENPEKVLLNEAKHIFYGSHPYGHNPLGIEENIEKISRQDLIDFYQEHFTKDNLLISIAGDINEHDAKMLLNDLFLHLPKNSKQLSLPSLEVNYNFEEQNIEREMPQVLARFVAKGTTRRAKDFYALYIANEIFGGSGLTSRLNLRAREKEGLTYGAYSYLDTKQETPMITGNFATSKENYAKMRTILKEEWQNMAQSGVTQEEFETIKNSMLVSFNLRFTSLSDISAQLLYMQKEKLGMDFLQKRNEYVRNVTLDEVNAAAKKYFSNIPSVLTIGNNE